MVRVIRQAMSDQPTLLVAEAVIPAGSGPHYAKLDDVEMLVLAGAADQDEPEYRRLLSAVFCGGRRDSLQRPVLPDRGPAEPLTSAYLHPG